MALPGNKNKMIVVLEIELKLNRTDCKANK